mmetsp:Transcript_37132/g.77745  ORF Transcript_37132/g.77745 Transcript_37132/m.77745 type:complete len:243 (-) Transcript_37132:24-752(-)
MVAVIVVVASIGIVIVVQKLAGGMRPIVGLLHDDRFDPERIAQAGCALVAQYRRRECRLPHRLIARAELRPRVPILRAQFAHVPEILAGCLRSSQREFGRAPSIISLGITGIRFDCVSRILYRESVVLHLDVRQCAIAQDDGIVGEVGQGHAVVVDGLGVVTGLQGGVTFIFDCEAFHFGFLLAFARAKIRFVVNVFYFRLGEFVFLHIVVSIIVSIIVSIVVSLGRRFGEEIGRGLGGDWS